MSTKHRLQEELRQKIDAEILQLRRRIAALATGRNSLTSISCLPTEILALIFHEAYIGAKAPLRGETAQSLNVSWVCRDWRRVALEYATLWTNIAVPSSSKGIAELLSRSRQALLSVSLSRINSQDIPPFVPAILRQLPRIRDLELRKIRSYETTHLLRLSSLCELEAPTLETLILGGVDLDERAFNGLPLPELRNLVLEICRTPWSLPLFSNLTTFVILDPHLKLPPATLLQILQRSPNIVELKLQDALDREAPILVDDPATSLIMLSFLKKLQLLREDSSTIVQLLRRISSNQMDQLCAYLDHSTQNEEPTEIVKEVLALHGKNQPLQGLYLLQDTTNCTIRTYKQLETTHPIELRLEYGDELEPDICSALNNLLNFSPLEVLDIRGNCETMTPHIWRTMFGHLPHLQVITAYEYMAESLCRVFDEEGHRFKSAYPGVLPSSVASSDEPKALTEYVEACAQAEEFLKTTTILFPALRELTLIYCMRFNDLDTEEGKGFPFNMTLRRFGGIGLTSFHYSDLPGSFPDPTPLEEGGIIDDVQHIPDMDL